MSRLDGTILLHFHVPGTFLSLRMNLGHANKNGFPELVRIDRGYFCSSQLAFYGFGFAESQ